MCTHWYQLSANGIMRNWDCKVVSDYLICGCLQRAAHLRSNLTSKNIGIHYIVSNLRTEYKYIVASVSQSDYPFPSDVTAVPLRWMPHLCMQFANSTVYLLFCTQCLN